MDLQSKYDYSEICDELGISLDQFLTFLKDQRQGISLIDSMISQSHREMDLNEAIDLYLIHLKKLSSLDKRSKLTYVSYLSFFTRLKGYLSNQDLSLKLHELNEVLLAEYFLLLNGRKADRIAPRTQNAYTAMVRSLFTHAYQNDWTTKKLSEKFSWNRVSLLPRYFQDSQVEEIMNASLRKTHGYRAHAIISFLLATGCRLGELVNMKVCDFDVNEDLIFINGGKGNKDRTIMMYPEIKYIILDYLNLTGLKKWEKSNHGYLFARDFGVVRQKRFSDRNVRYTVESLLKKLKIEGHSTHSFRHTFAVKCIKLGMRTTYLSLILGHSDPKTTFIYTQLLPKDLSHEVQTKYPFPLEKLVEQILFLEGTNERPRH